MCVRLYFSTKLNFSKTIALFQFSLMFYLFFLTLLKSTEYFFSFSTLHLTTIGSLSHQKKGAELEDQSICTAPKGDDRKKTHT